MMISVISPIYNEADNINELYDRVSAVFKGLSEEFELIMVENGSSDRSLEIIKGLQKKDRRVKYISLSRNFGHQGAIIAGLAYASGGAVISLDGDLQHPPELIPRMISLWKGGNDVVYTVKKPAKIDLGLVASLTRVFYKLISAVSDVELAYGQSDYRLLDRRVVDTILAIPEKRKFLRGMVQWVGFRQIGIEYDVEERKCGESKFSFWNYVNFAFDGIFSFSTAPLRIFLWFGLSLALISGIYGIVYVAMGLVNLCLHEKYFLPPGSATITASILFLGAVQLIGIGCLGEYIGRIYTQTKERPDFIVKEKSL
jgi:dolichol-phosphate mannosyltransferase